MDDEAVGAFVAFVVALVTFSLGFLIGTIAPEKGQDILNHFQEKPVCVEQTVGLDTIKKCYKLVEVK